MRYENYKSDLKVDVTLTLGGVAVGVPDHDFALLFRSDGGGRTFTCYRKGDEWVNCKAGDGVVTCMLDRHGLLPGVLEVEYRDYAPDADFADGNQLKVVPQELDIELVEGMGDDATEIEASVVVDIEGAISDAKAAALRANTVAAALEGKQFYTKGEVDTALAGKQDTLTAGTNITIVGNVISSTGGGGGGDMSNYYTKTETDTLVGAKYTKPVDGIPSSDLASAVQASLGKADTALQTQVQSDWNESSTSSAAYIANKPSIPAAQIQSDWTQSDNSAVDYIKNKPTIPVVPTTVSSFTNDANYASIPFVTIDSRKTTVSGNNYDTICGNGNGVSLTSGQLLLVYISTAMASGDYTLYLNIDQSHSYPATSNKTVKSLSHSSGQTGVKCKDIPQYTRLLLQYNGSMWVIVASGTIPVDLSGYATTSAVSSAIAGYCPIIADTRNDVLGTITGVAPFATLTHGQRIIIKLAYSVNANAAIKLTLNDGNNTQTNEIELWGCSNVDSHRLSSGTFRSGAMMECIYNETDNKWWVIGMLDTDHQNSVVSVNDIDTKGTYVRQVTGKVLAENFERLRTLVDDTDTSGTVTLSVNGYHDLGERSAVAVDLPSTYTRTDEFLFTFICDSAACTLSLPSGVELGSELDFSADVAAGRKFQVSIMDGIALYTYYDPEAEE